MIIYQLILVLILLTQLLRLFLVIKKNLKLKKETLIYIQYLGYLYYLTGEINLKIRDVHETFTRFLNTLREQIGWTYHSIFRLDEDKQLLVIRFTGYLPEWYMRDLSTKVFIKVGDAAIGRAVATKQPAIINTASSDPRFKNVSPLGHQTGYKSLSCYPMIGKLKTYGGFCTYSSKENIFTLFDTQFFMSVANIYAAILENHLLQNGTPNNFAKN